MKRILLLIVFLISFSAKADMDKICSVVGEDPMRINAAYVEKVIKESNCQRNNILSVWTVNKHNITEVISQFCRYDREVNYIFLDTFTLIPKDKQFGRLTCVLYSNKPRTYNPLT